MRNSYERLGSGIRSVLESRLCELHTSMPGRVVSFDANNQTCSVVPCLKRKFVDSDDTVELPIIEDVPVVYPGSDDLWLVFDLKMDSYVLIVFSERSIASWLDSGGVIDPALARKHALSDAIAVPGLLPNPDKLSASVETATIAMRNHDNTVVVKIEEDGTVTLDNGSASAVLEPGGNIVINGGSNSAVQYNGLSNAWSSITTWLNAHTHPVAGATAGPSVPPFSTHVTAAESPTIKVP